MYELKDKNKQKSTDKKAASHRIKQTAKYTAKECAYLAVFVALLIAVQVALALVPGVELVTVLFVSYAFVFGWKRGMAAATAFSVLRQLVFGFYPQVFVLYIIYYNLLTLLFGFFGEKLGGKLAGQRSEKLNEKADKDANVKVRKKTIVVLMILVIAACLMTAFFNVFDSILTPLWYRYSPRAREVYFYASLPFMIPQVICTAVSVSVLFLPLRFVFLYIKRGLREKYF